MGFAVPFTALFKIDPVNNENVKSPEKATFFISYFSKQSDNANVILKPVTFAVQIAKCVADASYGRHERIALCHSE